MKTSFRLLVTLTVFLATGTLFAFAEISRPPLDNIDATITKATVSVANEAAEAAYFEFTYTPSDGPFRSVLDAKLRTLKLLPPVGHEQDEYVLWIFVNSDWPSEAPLGYGGGVGEYLGREKPFRLARTDAGWIIPPEALVFTLKYGNAFRFYWPTVTGFELTALIDGVQKVFSTRGGVANGGQNDFNGEEGCELSSVRSTLRGAGIALIPKGVIFSNWSRLRLTLWEGAQETVFDYERRPEIRLVIRRLYDGALELSATGVKSLTLDMLEESKDLRTWSSPPELLRKSSGSQSWFTLRTMEELRFYRLKAAPPSPVQ